MLEERLYELPEFVELDEDVDDAGLLYVVEPLREVVADLDVDDEELRETEAFLLVLLLVPIPLRTVVEVLEAVALCPPDCLLSFLLSDEPFVWALGAVYLFLFPPGFTVMCPGPCPYDGLWW